jgi:hypothetical protein
LCNKYRDICIYIYVDMKLRKEVSGMEKECGQIKCIETDDGFRIEVTGKSMKEWFSCCCMPALKSAKEGKSECCPPKEEKK